MQSGRSKRNFPDNIFCDAIERDSDGQVSLVVNQQLNLGEFISEGLDASLSIQSDLQRIGVPGSVQISVLYSHLLNLFERFASSDQTLIRDNQLGVTGDWRNRANFSVAYKWKNLTLQWHSVFWGKSIDSRNRADFFEENGVEDPLFFRVRAVQRHDAFASIALGRNQESQLYFGVRNLFDDIGLFFPSGTIQGGSDNHISDFDVLGRYVYAGATIRF